MSRVGKAGGMLIQAERLYNIGAAIHWLHPKSKKPLEPGWTSQSRKTFKYLKESYIDGLNMGVVLGPPSFVGNKGFLSALDVDVNQKARDTAAKPFEWLKN